MPKEKTKRLLAKRVGKVGKFPTQTEDHIAELRQKAFAREGRNAVIARAILKELDRPVKQRESDRALGRRLGVPRRCLLRLARRDSRCGGREGTRSVWLPDSRADYLGQTALRLEPG